MNPQKIMAQILAMQTIPRVNSELAEQLDLKPYQHSIGLVTLTIDDVGYVALDEATKRQMSMLSMRRVFMRERLMHLAHCQVK